MQRPGILKETLGPKTLGQLRHCVVFHRDGVRTEERGDNLRYLVYRQPGLQFSWRKIMRLGRRNGKAHREEEGRFLHRGAEVCSRAGHSPALSPPALGSALLKAFIVREPSCLFTAHVSVRAAGGLALVFFCWLHPAQGSQCVLDIHDSCF